MLRRVPQRGVLADAEGTGGLERMKTNQEFYEGTVFEGKVPAGDATMNQKRIRIERPRPQGLLRPLLRLRQRYEDRPMWAEVVRYDGEQDFDSPALIVSEAEAMDAGLRVGLAVLLEDDLRQRSGTPPGGRICLITTQWPGRMPGQLIVCCQWWVRRTEANGRREELWREPKPGFTPTPKVPE